MMQRSKQERRQCGAAVEAKEYMQAVAGWLDKLVSWDPNTQMRGLDALVLTKALEAAYLDIENNQNHRSPHRAGFGNGCQKLDTLGHVYM